MEIFESLIPVGIVLLSGAVGMAIFKRKDLK